MSKFNKVDMQGKQWLQRVNGVPAWAAQDEGRILYDYATRGLYFGDDTEFVSAGKHLDVPLGTRLLFDTDTQLTGYTLLIDKNDLIAYITSGPGGANGGGGTQFGTWTFPQHYHTMITHQHSIGAHQHTITSITNHQHTMSGATGPGNACTEQKSDDSSPHCSHTHSFSGTTGGAGGHNHGGLTGSAGASNTGSGGGSALAFNSLFTAWRPVGRNFTRQERA